MISMDYDITTNIREHIAIRNSFNELAKDTFGIDFEPWYQKGFWTDAYQPFVIVENDQVVSNISASHLEFCIEGKTYSALQIGTVMTRAAYKNKGYAKALMHHILELYKGYDIVYLFSNKDAKGFYEKLGFKVNEESHYIWHKTFMPTVSIIRPLSMDKPKDRTMLLEYTDLRFKNPHFDVRGAKGIVAFYATTAYAEQVFYLESVDAIVIGKIEDRKLLLYDVISKTIPDMHQVITCFIDEPIDEVHFYYTPEFDDPELIRKPNLDEDSTFYIRTKKELDFNVSYPITAHA